jgi:gluconate 2-dehydrogenase gamma chain
MEEAFVHMSRREAVHRLTVLVGGTLSAPTMGALLSGCEARPQAEGWSPSALSRGQVDVLDVVVDRIIPPTDTPGAREVGVPGFIDMLLHEWAEPDERQRFLDGLETLVAGGASADGTAFLDMDDAEQMALLTQLDREAAQARENEVDPLPFFATLKEWTLVGYYTSEVGATQELQWLAAPGRYEADLSLEEVGRTWA